MLPGLIGPGFGSDVGSTITAFGHQATSFKTTSASSFTHSAMDVGAADDDRWVIAAIGAAGTGGTTGSISSFTIGGQTATILVQEETTAAGQGAIAAIGIVNLTTGTTADVAVTFNRSYTTCYAATYRQIGGTGTAFATNTDKDSDPLDMDCNTATGGALIGFVVISSSTSASITWTGPTQDFAQRQGGSNDFYSGAHTYPTTNETASNVNADPAVSNFEEVGLALALR
jgi:hypothetical protein